MDDITTILVALGVGAVLAFLGLRGIRKKDEDGPVPPGNQAADAARDIIHKTLEDGVADIQSDISGDDPAGDLADRGNARRRRRR